MLFGNSSRRIARKSAADLEMMRAAGRLASRCLQEIIAEVKPGITTQDIDDLQMQFCERHGVIPAPLNYMGSASYPFPKSICTSINEVVCHGIPTEKRILKEGDIVGVDVTLIVDGFHGDNAATVPVGAVSADAARLMADTLESLRLGIAAVRPGGHLQDIGRAIQGYVEDRGYSVVYEFVGHGIGRKFHEDPQVPHSVQRGPNPRFASGMTFTIEPMINEGVPETSLLDDEWTAVTADGKLSAQYEHTIAVSPDGVEILTVQNDDGSWEPPGRCELPKV